MPALAKHALLAALSLALHAEAQDDLAALSDEFDHPASILRWQRVQEVEGWNADQLERWEVDASRVGRMTLAPYTSTWYQDYRGVLVFKEVSGDFVATAEIEPRNRAESGPPSRSYSLAGIMARAPRPEVTSPQTWTPGGENYVFISLGTADAPGSYQFEVKTTQNSVSHLEISPGVSDAQLRMARIGSAVIVLLKPAGQPWRVHRRYHRPDLPESLQVGLTAYTDWGNVSPLAPLVHNQTVNTGGQPDLVAHADFFRYARPQIPAELSGSDLLDTDAVSDAELLGFLGYESVPNNPAQSVRINHEGRILGEARDVSEPTLFNTSEADAVMASLQIFPRNHGWNEDVSDSPVRGNSAAMIAQVKADLSASRQTLRPFYEMNYALVPAGQPLEPIDFTLYGDESDPSPYPIPDNVPVEGWPRETGGLSLEDWQADVDDAGGDRHSIVIQPSTGDVFETWQMRRVAGVWQASNGARFNLDENRQRPAGWTSADAGGHSMLGGLVRFDECARGKVEHAIRLIVNRTRRAYLYPANHYASNSDLATRPAMGERFRLKADFQIPEDWTVYEKAVCRALKKYGAIVMDNGGFFSISVAPDDRFPDDAFDNLRSIDIESFEVVEAGSASGGPRSPGAPAVEAGSSQAVALGATVDLQGELHDPSGAAAVQWTLYEGPAAVAIADSAALSASARLDVPGRYTFMLRADDGLHAPAFDIVSAIVGNAEILQAPRLEIELAPDGARVLRFVREEPPLFEYSIETSADLEAWLPSGLASEPEGGEDGQARIRATDDASPAAARVFYRLVKSLD